ncbi:MAG: tetratricopeptide repeat protein [Pseudomonadota bacterium]
MGLKSTTVLFAAIASALLQGCTSIETGPPVQVEQQPTLVFNDDIRFGQRPAIPSPTELLQLTPSQEQAFRDYLLSPETQNTAVNLRVSNYLENLTSGFHYQGDTLSATDALASNSGNCMSLALMTTALADIAGVKIAYQLMDDIPVFEYRGTVVEKGYHVRSILYNNKVGVDENGMMWYTHSGVKVDYFRTEQARFVSNLKRGDFLAMYYSNMAADSIGAGDYNTAYWYARESLLHAPVNTVAINMLAVVSRRTGDEARAEELYRFGIAHAEEKLTLLKNYRVLLEAQGRQTEALAIGEQLEKMEDPSPFHWLQLARTSYENGEFDAAVRYFRRALEMAPYMHEAYLGLAQSQYELGNNYAATASLRKALDNVYRASTRQMYKAKLYSLQQSEG